MDLTRFTKSKMFAKLIEHSLWRPRIPCTFRVVRLKLRGSTDYLSTARWFEKKDVETFCKGICCIDHGFSQFAKQCYRFSLVFQRPILLYCFLWFHLFSGLFRLKVSGTIVFIVLCMCFLCYQKGERCFLHGCQFSQDRIV